MAYASDIAILVNVIMNYIFNSRLLILCIFLTLFPLRSFAQTFYVAVDGNDVVSGGSVSNPWATISFAIDQVGHGATIEVAPGTYSGRVRLDQQFTSAVLVRSTEPYQARLRHDGGAVVICFSCQGITLEGFDIAHEPNNTSALVMQIQNTNGAAANVTLRNNIIHDSTNNDLLKVNNGASDVLIEGNIFYNQRGSDEHIDINSVSNVIVQDNVFFNSTPQSETSSFIVVKDSNANSDGVLGASNIDIKRNVFFNWQGNSGQSFVRIGEDGTSNFEARNVLVENNLMIGNSDVMMRSSFTVQGSSDITFRYNTVVGDLPSRNFAVRLLALGDNRANQNIILSNNIWSDPTGSMGTEGFVGADVFEALTGSFSSLTLNSNLYYNGGSAIPADSSQQLGVSDDANAILGNPSLPAIDRVNLPTFTGTQFTGGFRSIREIFIDLVERYGAIDANSAAIGVASAVGGAPAEDILGRPRNSTTDIGAFQLNTNVPSLPTSGVSLPWLFLLLDRK